MKSILIDEIEFRLGNHTSLLQDHLYEMLHYSVRERAYDLIEIPIEDQVVDDFYEPVGENSQD